MNLIIICLSISPLIIQIIGSPVPQSYKQRSPIQLNFSEPTINYLLYSPKQNYLFYSSPQSNCFYFRKVFIDNSTQRICQQYGIINVYDFSPNQQFMVIGVQKTMKKSLIMVFNITNQIINSNYSYSYSIDDYNMEIDTQQLQKIAISKENKIAIGTTAKILVMAINMSSTNLTLQTQHYFHYPQVVYTVFNLKWHPIDTKVLLIGTGSEEQGLYVWDTQKRNYTQASNKTTVNFCIFNSGVYLFQSSSDGGKGGFAVFKYQDKQLNQILFQSGKPYPQNMKISNDDNYLVAMDLQTNLIQAFYIDSTGPWSFTQMLKQTGVNMDFSSDGNQVLFMDQLSVKYLRRFTLCEENTFYTRKQCLICRSNCVNCHISATQCTSCDQNSFLESENCIQCQSRLIGCSKCTNGKICIQCNQSKQFILNQNKRTCECIAGKYINTETHQCKTCATITPGCQLCYDQNTCKQCNQQQDFWPTPQPDNTCACVSGKYYDPSKYKCLSCAVMIGCVKCMNSTICRQCDEDKNFTRNQSTSQCQCNQLHYYSNLTQSCQLCITFIPFCSECLETTKSEIICKSCNEGFTLNKELTICQCNSDNNMQVVGNKCVQKSKREDEDKSWILYAGIGGGILIALTVIIVLFCRCKKQKQKNMKLLVEEQDQHYFPSSSDISDQEKARKGLLASSLLSSTNNNEVEYAKR